MKDEIVIVGAGGHAEVVLEACQASNLKVKGFIDSDGTASIQGVKVMGNDDILNDRNFLQEHSFIVGIGDQEKRKHLSEHILHSHGMLATVIHPSAIISQTAEIGAGTCVGAGAVIQTGTTIGKYCIINTAAVIDHHCVLADGVHICPNATLSGGVQCEDGVLIGAGAVILPEVTIGTKAVIGAGSTILKDVPGNKVFVGSPAKEAV